MRLALLTGWLIALLSAQWAVACECKDWSVAQLYQVSRAVFTARVVSVQAAPIQHADQTVPGKHVTLRVISTLKGSKVAGSTEVRDTYDDDGLCGVPVKVGDEVLVYSFADSPRAFGRCNTRYRAEMAADVAKLKGITDAGSKAKGP
jgi:hypothetical protein